jgi:hypothetical protein
VGDEVDLQETGGRLVPIRERPHGYLSAGLGRRLPLPAVTRCATDWRQQPVDGRWTGREQELTDIRFERQMAVPLPGRDQPGEDGFEAFATDAIRSLPEHDERTTDRLRIDPPTGLGYAGQNADDGREEADRMFSVTGTETGMRNAECSLSGAVEDALPREILDLVKSRFTIMPALLLPPRLLRFRADTFRTGARDDSRR